MVSLGEDCVFVRLRDSTSMWHGELTSAPQELSAEDIARRSMKIASDTCIYTNHNYVIESLDSDSTPTTSTPTSSTPTSSTQKGTQ